MHNSPTGAVDVLAVRTLEQDRRNEMLSWQIAGLSQRLSTQQAALSDAQAAAHRSTDLQQQNTLLAKLCVACDLLHGSPRMADVLSAIQDVVINLIGSEEFAVADVDADGSLTPLLVFGVDEARVADAARSLAVVDAIRTGEARLAEEVPLLAALPMSTGGRMGAMVLIYGLLPQKGGWVPFDDDLFSLLRLHGGAALHTARLHALLAGNG
ncbi:MAG TPA: hypothetical protein VF665_13025 [Longimicrobium sp.]|jgi:hypothetical protein|uniref:hypothetical protein n=1 Tax=Longimicrobium sp. TaxID=2029185 RepID=UPI002EDB710A